MAKEEEKPRPTDIVIMPRTQEELDIEAYYLVREVVQRMEKENDNTE